MKYVNIFLMKHMYIYLMKRTRVYLRDETHVYFTLWNSCILKRLSRWIFTWQNTCTFTWWNTCIFTWWSELALCPRCTTVCRAPWASLPRAWRTSPCSDACLSPALPTVTENHFIKQLLWHLVRNHFKSKTWLNIVFEIYVAVLVYRE